VDAVGGGQIVGTAQAILPFLLLGEGLDELEASLAEVGA
jgi:hypothetical protein